ncbi:DUF5723 family protein [Flavobacterium sp. TMP13]|uniref:DUF5723 family protein n=1 Tax=Flavobacterium sp. TMP13 TaxID=3425950 RepID=UPI003D76A902
MKRTLLLMCFVGSCFAAQAQSYFGFRDDGYAGIQAALFNPSAIVDSKYRSDITLFSVSGSGSNDLYGVQFADVIGGDYDFENQASTNIKFTNNAVINLDVMGPSFMMNITPLHSVALFSRVRSVTNFINVNGELIDELNNDIEFSNNFLIQGGSPNAVTNSWAEIGASYATVLLDKEDHFIKGGLTLKYLMAGINGYIQGNEIEVAFNKNEVNPSLSEFYSTGTLKTAASYDYDNGDDPKFDASSAGIGLDLGFTYEYRTFCHTCKGNRYKFKAAMSVTDIGKLNYKNAVENSYDLTGRITQDDIDESDDIFKFFDSYYTKVATRKGVKANLPTAFHTNFDWNINNKFYLNLSGDFDLVDAEKLNGTTLGNSVSFTPRFEIRQFSFYVPITWMEYSGTQVGTGFRAGPLFIGSGSIISNLLSNNSKAFNMYVGLKIPVYQNYK